MKLILYNNICDLTPIKIIKLPIIEVLDLIEINVKLCFILKIINV